MKQRILIVDDDHDLAQILIDNLTFEGYDVRWIGEGSLAVSEARDFSPDLVLLDVMLPDRSGFELCSMLTNGGKTPIMFLTARGERSDKLHGLKLGADDYVIKPFDLEELLARVRNLLRRADRKVEKLRLGNVTIDFRRLIATREARVVDLSYRELDLLRYLAERQEQVVSRRELLRAVWGYADVPTTRSVDQAIVRLRKKIEPDPQHPQFIHTVHGDGYSLTPRGLPPMRASK